MHRDAPRRLLHVAEPPLRRPFYVFPSLEAHSRINADHLTDRVRRVFKAAGFYHTDPGESVEDTGSRRQVQQARAHGVRRASVRDFHSFRVSWVTVALTAGVPLENCPMRHRPPDNGHCAQAANIS